MKQRTIVFILMCLTTYSIGQGQVNEWTRAKRIEVFSNWIRKNNIVFRQLPKANPDELIYDCDSIPIVKQIKGDTLIYWVKTQWSVTGGIYLDNDIKELDKQIKEKSFGLTDYVERLDNQGNVVLVSLRPKKFKIKNDSLFELTSFLKISEDSLKKVTEQYVKNRDFDFFKKIYTENHYRKFEVIFHPKMFVEDRVFERKEIGDKIILEHSWKVGEKNYYEITFNKESDERIVKFPRYLFDDKYRFIEYDGCNSSETRQLTSGNEVKSE